MSEELKYKPEDLVETEGRDRGRIKDKHLAESLARDEEAVRNGEPNPGNTREFGVKRQHIEDGLREATGDSLSEHDYAMKSRAEARKVERLQEQARKLDQQDIRNQRAKIAGMDGTMYTAEDAIETEGIHKGRVKDPEMAKRMAEKESYWRGFWGKLEHKLAAIIGIGVPGRTPTREEGIDAAGEKEAMRYIREKKTEDVLKAGYDENNAGIAAGNEVERYARISKEARKPKEK
jgi:hypothetical protein